MRLLFGVVTCIITIFLLALFTNAIMSWDIFPGKVAGETENWIGFYATLISGFITLFGVILTIQFNKKQIGNQKENEIRKEEKEAN